MDQFRLTPRGARLAVRGFAIQAEQLRRAVEQTRRLPGALEAHLRALRQLADDRATPADT